MSHRWSAADEIAWCELGDALARALAGKPPAERERKRLARLANRLRSRVFPTADKARWMPLTRLLQQTILVFGFEPGEPIASLRPFLTAVDDILRPERPTSGPEILRFMENGPIWWVD